MRKFKINSNKWLFPFMLLTMLGIASCDPDDDANLGPMRMFSPGGVISSVSSTNNVRLTWRTPPNTVEANTTYTVEVALDSMFQTPVILAVQTDSSGVVFTDEQLEVQQLYYARVKSNAFGDRPESNWVHSSRFMIRGEQILLPLGTTDITNNSALLRWNPYAGLTRIVLTPLLETGEGTPIEVPLTEADVAASMKEVSGLEASTSYRVQIFQNNIMRGFMTIRTISGIAGTVVDLTGITDNPDILTDTLLSPLVTSGSTIVLAKGVTYNISSTIALDKSITIMSELSTDPNLATLFFTSNFTFAAGSNVDSVVFRDVVMRSDNYASRYVFNINNATTVNRIKFDGTHTEIFRGVVRLQSGGIILNNYEIINSVVDSISNFAVLTVGNTTSFAHNVLWKNSTFYKVERGIVSSSPAQSVIIENCTFNEAPEATRYVVDYGANTVLDGVKVINSIFGIGKALGNNRDARGIRAASPVESTGSYSTADRVVTSHPIPGITTYSKTSFELFQDPRNGNFTIIDSAFPGRNTAGDPRWRP